MAPALAQAGLEALAAAAYPRWEGSVLVYGRTPACAVGWSGSRFVAIGDGVTAVSPDDCTWTTRCERGERLLA